jgi:hypothetical protein
MTATLTLDPEHCQWQDLPCTVSTRHITAPPIHCARRQPGAAHPVSLPVMPAGASFAVGDEVEVLGNEEGFLGSWYAVREGEQCPAGQLTDPCARACPLA